MRILSANFAAKLQNIMQTANNIGRKKTMTDNFYLFPEMTLKTRYFDDADIIKGFDRFLTSKETKKTNISMMPTASSQIFESIFSDFCA